LGEAERDGTSDQQWFGRRTAGGGRPPQRCVGTVHRQRAVEIPLRDRIRRRVHRLAQSARAGVHGEDGQGGIDAVTDLSVL